MNRLTELRSTSLVSIARFDHPQDTPHRDQEEEHSIGFSVNFVESGRFHVVAGRQRYTVDGGALFVTRPGFVFHCRHDREVPEDICFSVDYAADLADSSGYSERRPPRTRGGRGGQASPSPGNRASARVAELMGDELRLHPPLP